MQETIKRGLVMAAAAGAVVLGGAGAGADTADGGWAKLSPDSGVATRDLKNVGGGTWNYGTHATYGYSNYLHEKKCHGSSINSGDKYKRDWGVRAGNWAITKIPRDGTSSIYAYWRNTC
ncbi:lactococcin 972 family bacteriocin [Actinoallomurus rhizosphaericola]|uniref:lactococcin 972 family bacteriocin n=1 Tax=Actinoallomurus rhizosphaericola TaxID=2952536 RepID=UPI002092810D|nr:lactococcin 972 family bacteriocin [Actinoallomurus rhizosphaericola]MCO5999244.1 lactococcin 972 family bacteriocin [Actinoallomurus rhizosphaericola]